MADLGAFTISMSNANSGTLEFPRIGASKLNPKYTGFLDTPCNGTRSGIVTLNDVPVANVLVRLYWRENGVMIVQQFTKADGTYLFQGLDPTAGKKYMIMFVDPKEDPPYNYTLTQDHLAADPE